MFMITTVTHSNISPKVTQIFPLVPIILTCKKWALQKLKYVCRQSGKNLNLGPKTPSGDQVSTTIKPPKTAPLSNLEVAESWFPSKKLIQILGLFRAFLYFFQDFLHQSSSTFPGISTNFQGFSGLLRSCTISKNKNSFLRNKNISCSIYK